MSLLLPTTVVGSYAWPCWLHTAMAAVQRGEYGPADVAELENDAVDMAIRDQEDAGVDIITDGEMRRAGFFTAAFYGHITGLKSLEPDRKVGAGGHDQQHRFKVLEPITCPNGFGTVAEFQYARTRTSKPLMVPLPGPFTLAGRLTAGPNEVYKNREEVAWAMVPMLRAEIQALLNAGVKRIQVDEPSPAIHPDAKADFAGLFNATLKDLKRDKDVVIGTHLCFGNYIGRPYSKRTYQPVLDEIMKFNVDYIHLEFAGREMAEIEMAGRIAREKTVAVGVIDVKSYYHETAQDVAERIRIALKHVPAERLVLAPDCGFSQTSRKTSRRKMQAMVEGARIVRKELA
jgi:5-methyltetrahydropteroyltriglutamate--homocysteine methyltransferase